MNIKPFPVKYVKCNMLFIKMLWKPEDDYQLTVSPNIYYGKIFLPAATHRRVLLEKKRLDKRVIWLRWCGGVYSTADKYLQLLSNYFLY